MTTTAAVYKMALEMGFERAFILEPARVARTELIAQNAHINDDARDILPGARAIILLLRAYAPYEASAERGRGARLSAYYPASNEAYARARQIARALGETGARAVANSEIAIKPTLITFGLGEPGRNGLVSLPGVGTRFNVQAVITDAFFSTLKIPAAPPEYRLSPACENCNACVDACPAGALDGTGRVDVSKCLRALPAVMPDRARPLIGDWLLGCDICQEVCPRNAGVKRAPMPAGVESALALDRLLAGDIKPLAAIVGANLARLRATRMRAALIAGNKNRADLTGALEALAREGDEREREHALWALTRLQTHKQREE